MPKILLLGGTGEARELADLLTREPGVDVVSSLAGRVRAPRPPLGRVRVGGFGGVDGLRDWIISERVDLVVDATHPFAVEITAHAAVAAAAATVPLLRLCRPGWTESRGDRWIRVRTPAAAADALRSLGERVLLTIGRQGVAAFADLVEPWFLIRSIDPPEGPLPPRHELLLSRGPFTTEQEQRLLADRAVEVVVTKDSGGDATAAKLTAAAVAGLPVVMIDRPPEPAATTLVDTPAAALAWLRASTVGTPGSR